MGSDVSHVSLNRQKRRPPRSSPCGPSGGGLIGTGREWAVPLPSAPSLVKRSSHFRPILVHGLLHESCSCPP